MSWAEHDSTERQIHTLTGLSEVETARARGIGLWSPTLSPLLLQDPMLGNSLVTLSHFLGK
jgi:hypothetical protein